MRCKWAFSSFAFLSASVVFGQINIEKQLEPYKRVVNLQGKDQEQMYSFKEGRYILSKPTAEDLAVLERFAQSLIYKITLPEYHIVDEGGAVLKAKDPLKTIPYLQARLKEHLLTPDVLKGKFELPQQFYIIHFGAALDKSINDILNTPNVPTILRIAALRMLVTASETGAPAHWNTVEKLLTAKNPRPDDFYYGLKALENLIKTFDPGRMTWFAPNVAAGEARIVKIEKLLEDVILNGPPLMDRVYITKTDMPALSTDKKDPAATNTNTADHQAVFRFYRLQAIRALSQFKLEILGGLAEEARPMFLLAKVAIGDPTLKLSPSTKEVGEALVGLASIKGKKAVNYEEWAYALGMGIRNFAMPKSGNTADDSVAWKGYAARLQAAMTPWKDDIQKNAAASANAKKISADLVRYCDNDIFNPLQGRGGVINAQNLNTWLQQNPSPTKGQLFNDKKELTLTYGK